MTLRQNGSASGWLLGLLVTPMLRKYRLSGGCPISLRVGIRFDSLSRFLGSFHTVSCTYSIGATSAALGTAGPTSSRTGEQA